MRRYLGILGLTGLLLLALKGSCKGQGNAGDLGGVTFRVTLLNEWHGPQLYARTGKAKYEKIDMFRMAYTKPFRYQAGQTITLYVERDAADGETAYVSLMKIKSTVQMLEPLLVLHWNAKLKKARGKLIEFSTKVFPYGSYQIANMSDAPIVGYIGEPKGKHYCKANKECIIRSELNNGARTPIVFYSRVGGETKPVFSTMTIHRSQKRIILFFTQGQNRLGRTMLFSQSLVDFKAQPETGS